MHLDLAMHQVQDDVGLTCILDPIRLDLVVSQVQGGVSLARMTNSIYLDLTISQVQGGSESDTHVRLNAFGLGN